MNEPQGKGTGGGEIRFTAGQRIQHVVLLVSLLLLAASGLVLRFHDNIISDFLLRIEGGMGGRSLIHKAAAVLLIAVSAWHVLFAAFTEHGRSEAGRLLFRAGDFSRFLSLFGLSSAPASTDAKFGVKEKVQYWGVAAGVAVMAASGLLLWMKRFVFAFAPKWLVDVLLEIHGAAGIVLFAALVLWHLYNVHLNPDDFPMSMTWLTGRRRAGAGK